MVYMYTSCSWDVGITNLAFCKLQVDKSSDKWLSIKNLGIIDLASNKKFTCESNIKNGSICGKKAKFCGKDLTDITRYYCGTHKDIHKTIVATSYNDIGVPPGNICTVEKCKAKATFLTMGKLTCTPHKNRIRKAWEKDHAITSMKKIKLYKVGIDELAENMFTALNSKPELFNVDYVYIENQPSLTNPTMKTVSVLLYAFYAHKKMLTESTIKSINFVAPSSKLNVEDDSIFSSITDQKTLNIINKIKIEIGDNSIDNINIILSVVDKKKFEQLTSISSETKNKILSSKHAYALTKILSVVYIRYILVQYAPEWIEYYDGISKSDDVADAVSHAIRQATKNK